MSPRPLSVCRCVVASFFLLAAARLGAQLTANSPFQPLPSSIPTAPVAETPLKYGGFVQTQEGTQYRITDPARKLAAWLKLDQRDDALGVVVKRYDPASSSLTVEYNGRSVTLTEPKPKLGAPGAMPMPMPAPAPTAVPVTAPATNMSPAVTQTVVPNPTSADEQRRLDAVAAEIARRRAMREQAGTPGANGPTGPQPATAVPPQPITNQAIQR